MVGKIIFFSEWLRDKLILRISSRTNDYQKIHCSGDQSDADDCRHYYSENHEHARGSWSGISRLMSGFILELLPLVLLLVFN